MTQNSLNILPLKEAADKFQVENLEIFKRRLKKIHCIISIAGIEFVDVEKLQEQALAKVQSNGNGNRVRRTPNPIGLLRARVNTYPRWLEGKRAAITAARLTATVAQNPYEKARDLKKLNILERDLERMEGNFRRDKNSLDSILNASYGNDEPVQASSTLPGTNA